MKNVKSSEGILLLETGFCLLGRIFGYEGDSFGEVVFNTALVGYEEVITDPSYYGQIVCMTYPHIGNYGITNEDFESQRPWISGFIISQLSSSSSNWRARETIQELFVKYKVTGIEQVDTRALTRYIRTNGAMRGIITTKDPKSALERLLKYPKIEGRDLVKDVSCKKEYKPFDNKNVALSENEFNKFATHKKFKVAVIDCGCKFNIFRSLNRRGCDVVALPADSSFEKILSIDPDGILFSNGPGDPEAVNYVYKIIEKFISYEIKTKDLKPIFGICLGHQMLGLALGAKIYKLKFGHHGINHPVKNLINDKIEITSQNHNFAVKIVEKDRTYYVEENSDIEVTHINLNDGSCEGLKHKTLPIFSVQYHPEASPGPNDSNYLFDEFVDKISIYKNKVIL